MNVRVSDLTQVFVQIEFMFCLCKDKDLFLRGDQFLNACARLRNLLLAAVLHSSCTPGLGKSVCITESFIFAENFFLLIVFLRLEK